jgi:glycosyltransferase involved in cell wall biosynthesis
MQYFGNQVEAMENTTKTTPKVSIGMPVYNGVSFIREALDSLMGQTFPDFELIISDNASTDGTTEICREYAKMDSRIIYTRQTTNIGAVANFDFVLDQAGGQYFMWAAHDDVWSRNFIEALLEIVEHQEAIAFGWSIKTNEYLLPIKMPILHNYIGSRLFRCFKFYLRDDNGKGDPTYALLKRSMISSPTFTSYPNIAYGSDYIHLFKLLQRTVIIHQPKCWMIKRGAYIGLRSKSASNLNLVIAYFTNIFSPLSRDRLNHALHHITILESNIERVLFMFLIPVKIIYQIAQGCVSETNYAIRVIKSKFLL